MTKMNDIRTVVLVAFLAALPIGLIAQTQTSASKGEPGSVAVTTSPVAVEPSSPAVALSDKVNTSRQQRSMINEQPDYSTNPYWEPRDQGYINENQSGG
jgi:hypothetical protein